MDKETRKVLGFIALAMCFILPYSLITGATIYDAVCLGAYNRFSIGNAVVLGIIYISIAFLFFTEVFGK